MNLFLLQLLSVENYAEKRKKNKEALPIEWDRKGSHVVPTS